MATIISLVFSFIILFNWGLYFDPLPTDVISYVEGFYGLGFLIALVLTLAWNKSRITPLAAALMAYPVFTFAIAVFLASRVVPNALYLIPVWLAITGLATDGFLLLMKRSNPPTFGDLKNKIKHSADILQYQEGIDSLTESTAKAINSHSISQTNKALNFFSTVYDGVDIGEGKEIKILYPLEMLEMLARSSIEKNLTVVTQRIFTTEGTLGLECLKVNPNLAPFAITKIEQGTLLAMKHNQFELALKGIITLQQTALMAPDLTGWGPFVAQAVQSLGNIARESFKLDKNQSISKLTAPIIDINHSLKAYEKSAEYPHAKMEVDRVLDEFRALEAILKQMPKIEETAKT